MRDVKMFYRADFMFESAFKIFSIFNADKLTKRYNYDFFFSPH